MSVTCEICGKEFKNSQGLRGHKTFVHQMTTTQDPPDRPATEPQVSKLEDRLQKLGRVIGVREPSAQDRLLGTDKSLTEQLEQHTRQLTELGKQLNRFTERLELVEVRKLLAMSNGLSLVE